MINGGRGEGSQGDKFRAQALSPTPSTRHISTRRLNIEREPLLKNHNSDYLSFGTSSGSKSQPKNLADSDHHSEESIVVQRVSPMETSESIIYIPPDASDRREPGVKDQLAAYIPVSRNDTPEWRILFPYYLPILSWVTEYCSEYFVGDLIGGVSLATFQIPLAISYSTSLAKVPITCGLYSLGVAPLIYMLLGSVPQMIVGPEAPISLIVGQAVEPLLHHSKSDLDPVDYVVVITFVSGATLLGFGLGRFGFLDNVLCECLLKGFIFGVGVVMVINSSISMLGLSGLLEKVINDLTDMDIHSPFDKLKFLIAHYRECHRLTLCISLAAFATILLIRRFKSLATRSKSKILKRAVYFPEILLVVVASTILCHKQKWNHSGVDIVGSVDNVDTSVPIFNPLSPSSLSLFKRLATSGFVCAMLGFFESTTALKSLGSRYELPISSNRELVALGTINVVGSIFGALPAFGGYGRSKINARSAKTTTSGAIMGVLSLATVGSVLKYLHYIPKCILSVITAVIGISLMSEAPAELAFHWRSRGLDELITFSITVITTLFFSMEAGIAVGLIYLLIRVIKNSAESNIQILGRVPGTNTFLDADLANDMPLDEGEVYKRSSVPGNGCENGFEKRVSQLNLFTDKFRPLNYQALEEIEGCLIIKIPEPLKFTNASDLSSRLKRIELYGSAKAHPALKRSRDASMTKYMIFDLEGMSDIDSSAAQILKDSLSAYQQRNIRSFFVRVSKNRQLRERLKNTGIAMMLSEDLRAMRYYEMRGHSLWHKFVGSHGLNDNHIDDVLNSLHYNQGPNRNHVLPVESFAETMIESSSLPYFEHIREALKVIDFYELHYPFDSNTV